MSRNGGPVGRVFVSYTEADEAWATWIAWQLDSDGWQVDVQAWDLAPGANFVGWMNDRLGGADHVLIVVSWASLTSGGWVGVGWQSAYAPDERRVVPVRIEPVGPDGLLAKLVRIDLFDMDSDDARHRLLRRMRAARLGVIPRPKSSPVFPGGASRPATGEMIGDAPSFPGSDRIDVLVDRVADAAAARYPGAIIRRVTTGTPMPYLDIDWDRDGERIRWAIGVATGLDRPRFEAFRDEVHREYEDYDTYAESEIVCAGAPVAAELVRMARRGGVAVRSLAEFEGRWDPAGYLARQTSRIERDTVYPPDLYVAQGYVELDGRTIASGEGISASGEGASARDLCAAMVDWLDADGARFLLVLGDFGHGKTFLLHELARRLPVELPKAVPMLVELKDLEKSQSIDDLLALHLQKSGEDGVSVRAVRRMLERGRVILLFDGFDELAMRVTFDKAAEHLKMITSAVSGRAKVVLTSRTQHFASDDQWRTALGEEVRRRVAGSRTVRVTDFDEPRIREFLVRGFTRQSMLASLAAQSVAFDVDIDTPPEPPEQDDPAKREFASLVAEAERRADVRLGLIRDIRDLLGLSGNPRMLSFIAELDEQDLVAVRAGDGTISSADLYAMLVDRWLRYEARRRWPSPQVDQDRGFEQLRQAVDALARHLWDTGEDATDLDGLAATVQRAVTDLSQAKLDPKQATFAVGSGSLLVRKDDDRFAFVHRSVMEYLVAASAADRIGAGSAGADALGTRPMSDLMVDFLVSSADKDKLAAWVREALRDDELDGIPLRENLFRVASRLRVPGIGLHMSGRDFRGQDLSGHDLRWANLSGAVLSGVRWHDVDLTGADLSGVDARGARFERVALSDAKLDGGRWDGAVLAGATFCATGATSPELRAAAVVGRDRALPMLFPRGAGVDAIAHSPYGDVLAVVWGPSLVLHDSETLRPVRVVNHRVPGTAVLLFGASVEEVAVLDREGRLAAWRTSDGLARDVARGVGTILTIVRTVAGEILAVASRPVAPDPGDRAYDSREADTEIWDVFSGERQVPYYPRQPECFVEPPRAAAAERKLTVFPDLSCLVRIWPSADRPAALFVDLGPRPGTTSLAASGSRSVYDVAVGPDGSTMAFGTGEPDGHGVLELRPSGLAQDFQRLREIPGHAGSINLVLFSPDGRLLLSGDNGRVVRRRLGGMQVKSGSIMITEVETGRRKWSADLAPEAVRPHASFHPDSHRLVVAGREGLETWDAGHGQRTATFEPHPRRTVVALAFGSDGRSLWMAVSSFGAALAWRWRSSELTRDPGADGCAVISNVADRATSGQHEGQHGDRHIQGALEELGLWRWLDKSVSFTTTSPDARLLVTVEGASKRITIWDASSGYRRTELTWETLNPTCAAFGDGGRLLAVGASVTGWLMIWEIDSGQLVRELGGHRSKVSSVAFSPDGDVLASAEGGQIDSGTVLLWDVASGDLLREIVGHDGGVSSVVFHPDGILLASADSGERSGVGRVRLWDALTGRLVAALAEHVGGAASLAFSPDGRLLTSGGADGCVQLWDVSALAAGGGSAGAGSAARLATIALFDDGASAVLLPDGSYKLTGDPGDELWWSVGLARFEPGELDAFDPTVRRLPDDAVIPGLERYARRP